MSEQAIVKPEKTDIVLRDGKPEIGTLSQASRMANGLVRAGWTKLTPEQATMAIMHGAVLGLNPFQAVQGIAVINGRPTVWGDALVAVVRASGKCQGIDVETTGEGDAMASVATVYREGDKNPTVRKFSMADAKKAGLAGKGTWSSYPRRMLEWRAKSWALRDAFADVLQGVGIREELDDEPAPQVEPVTVEATVKPAELEPDDDGPKFLSEVLPLMEKK